MSLMCVTCSSIKFDELVKTVCKVSQSEAGGKLDSFVKKLLLDAADESNRHELFAVLRENNPEKMSLFITKYVKDFPKKFHQFVFREIFV